MSGGGSSGAADAVASDGAAAAGTELEPPSNPVAGPHACFSVWRCAVSAKRAGSLRSCSVMSGIRPSSTLGVATSKRMVESSVEMLSDGTQEPLGGIFSVSRHTRPLESMFG